MRPREVVRAWVEAFNRADVDALAGLYEEGAVNHQVAGEPVEGRAAIRAMFADGFARAAMDGLRGREPVRGQRVGGPRMARPARPARLRLLPRPGGPDRLPARLLGQALLPQAARLAPPAGTERRLKQGRLLPATDPRLRPVRASA